jgi:DNA gyrase/topoisomerase IV subunit A
LLRAQDLGWQLVEAVGQADDKATARAVLMAAPFEFDAIAAAHVLDMQLSGRTRLAVQNRKEEHQRLIEFLGQQ